MVLADRNIKNESDALNADCNLHCHGYEHMGNYGSLRIAAPSTSHYDELASMQHRIGSACSAQPIEAVSTSGFE